MSFRGRLVALSLLAIVIAGGMQANAQTNAQPNAPVGTTTPLFTEDDQLLFDVTADGYELSDGLSGYSSRVGVFLPLGELSRVLDFAVQVDPAELKADGWFIREDRRLHIDVRAHTVSVDGKDFTLSDTDAVFAHQELYLRSDIIEKIFPIKLKIDKSDLSIAIVPREHLPFEDKIEREQRRLGLKGGGEQALNILHVPSSYELYTPPSADFTIDEQGSNQAPHLTSTWEARLGGDVGYAGAQLFAGSDANGVPDSLRLLLERKDPDGKIAGLFGATKSDAGDVFTPSLAIGSVSQGGRGISMSSVPLDQASVFSTTDLRGELPQGYEVELYVNEVLRGSQSEPVRGYYEFLSVPLSYGINVIRLVFYGPRGERREEVSRINVGSGQLQAGQFTYSLAAVQQQVPLFDIDHAGKEVPGIFGIGDPRLTASAAYGLNEDFTLTGALAQYTPNTPFDPRQRDMATAGLLTSFAGFALNLGGAADNQGGLAAQAGVAGRLFDVSLLAHDSEYWHGFVDEVQFRTLAGTLPISRASDVTADWTIPLPFTDIVFPMSVHAQRNQLVDGSEALTSDAHVSTALGQYLLSGMWQYEQQPSSTGSSTTSQGSFDVSTFLWRKWQVRAETTFDGEPKLSLSGASLEIDGTLSPISTVRFGATHTFALSAAAPVGCSTSGSNSTTVTPPSNNIATLGSALAGGCAPPTGSTTIDASTTWHFATFDLTFNGTYTPETHDVVFGIQLALGALFDPVRGQYIQARPGAAAGGSAILQAFVDKNGDGIKNADESGVGGITAQGSNWPATTDSTGEALISGLGDAAHARVRVDQDSIADPYLLAPADAIEVVPHPGQVTVIPYPLRTMGEVTLRFMFSRDGEKPRGLSALEVQAVRADGSIVAEGRSEYDGTLILERLPSGTYTIRIDPDQAKRLKLALAAPLTVTIPAKGGYIGQVSANVVIAQ